MNFWKVVFVDATEIEESLVDYWDRVPDKEIFKVILFCRDGDELVIHDFDKICVAKIGMGSIGSNNTDCGYVVTYVQDDVYRSLRFSTKGLMIDEGSKDIPERCFRRGVRNDSVETKIKSALVV